MRQIVPVLLASLAVACGGSSEPAPAPPPTEPPVVRPVKPAQWAVDWADEFNGATVDTTNWIIVEGAASINNELQFYTPSDVYLENGDLVLRSQRRTFGNRQYSSGEVRTSSTSPASSGWSPARRRRRIPWRSQSTTVKRSMKAFWNSA